MEVAAGQSQVPHHADRVYYRLAKLLPLLGRTADGMAVALLASSELQARQLALEPWRTVISS